MNSKNLQKVADNVARALSFAQTNGTSAYITTAVTYANGTAVIVRVDNSGNDFFVTDDGFGYQSAELMGAENSFNKIAPNVASRFGVEFDRHSFFVLKVNEAQLPAAVATIANVSATAVERTIFAIEQHKAKQSMVLFENKLQEAFGDSVQFEAKIQGATKEWKFDAALTTTQGVSSIFELVSPAYTSITSAHMKLGDIRHLARHPKAIAVLRDYDKTDPGYRSILSTSSDSVISIDRDVSTFKKVA